MKKKNKKNIAIALNILLIILEIIGAYLSLKQNGLTLNFYTEDSNIFAMLVSIIYLVYIISNYNKKNYELPKWVSLLKYMAVTSLTVTFLVVIFILSPMMSNMGGFGIMMYKGSMLYHHTLCPIVAIISFIFYEDIKVKGSKDALFASLFTIIYGAIIIVLNIMKVVYGPYPFLHVYEQPVYMSFIWAILIIGGSYGIGYLLQKIKRNV